MRRSSLAMAVRMPDADAGRRLRAPLLRWYRRAKRDLPWRRTKDPYAIWVSEVMLQQTTVAAVIPYWRRFLDRFPDVSALAAAREEEVLALWSGLGYYRRARALRQGATAVMARHAGRVPDDLDALLALPGVGRYTAGAIASLAFDRPCPVVDGNVKRVFSRLFAIGGRRSAATERTYWSIAETMVGGRSPGSWNQALMELGARICTPRSPACTRCPVAGACRARALGRPESFPPRAKPAPPRILPVAVAWIVRHGRVLLVPGRPGGALRGAWDLPAVVVPRARTPAGAIVRGLSTLLGVRARASQIVLRARHSILRNRLVIDVVAIDLVGGVPGWGRSRWVALNRLEAAAISGATAKIARLLAGRHSRGSRGRENA